MLLSEFRRKRVRGSAWVVKRDPFLKGSRRSAVSVIINELEVVLESPASTGPAKPLTPPPPPTQQMQPIDVTDILEREARAQARLIAH